jgi:hypothetical protein
MAISPITPVRIARKVREPRIEGDLAYVPLGNGPDAVIDAAAAHLVEHRNWSMATTGYARTGVYVGGGEKDQTVLMHRHIVGATASEHVDHIDGDKLNNRRSNLRVCSRSQNLANRGVPTTNKTGFKGVSICKQTRSFRAQLKVNGEVFRIGRFKTAKEAALAYDQVAKKHLGEFARLNFG